MENILQEPKVQRVVQHDPNTNVPERIAAAFIRIKYNLSISIQKRPEMTDEELLIANSSVGGFDWLNDPSEDVYK